MSQPAGLSRLLEVIEAARVAAGPGHAAKIVADNIEQIALVPAAILAACHYAIGTEYHSVVRAATALAAAKRLPYVWEPWLVLGRFCIAEGDAKGAERAFCECIEIAPDWPDAWAGLALAHRAQSRGADAIAALRTALDLCPIHPSALTALAASAEPREASAAKTRFGASLRLYQSQQNFIPTVFSIETFLGCNLRCPDCAVGGEMVNRAKGAMSLSDYQIIASRMAPYAKKRSVLLQLWGEPMMNKDIIEIIRSTVEFGNAIISTNGITASDRMIGDLAKSGVSQVIVSIDGATQETYERYRVRGNINKAFEFLDKLNKAKIALGVEINILPQFIVFKHNEHEMPAFAEKCRSMGLQPFFKEPYVRGGPDICESDTRWRRQSFATLSEYSKFLSSVCTEPKAGLNVFVDGTVVPCCYDHNASVKFGNILDEPLMKIWWSDRYTRFRNDFYFDQLPEFCRDNCLFASCDELKRPTACVEI